MKNAALVKAQDRFISQLVSNCSYALTMQTNLRTHNISARTMEGYVGLAQNAMAEFRPKLNRMLTGNGYLRNSMYMPVLVCALEGRLNTYDRGRTLHYHLAIGNFDHARIDDEFLKKLAGHWIDTEVGTDDVLLVPMSAGHEAGWGHYISKENRDGNDMCIDFENTQMPAHLLAN